MKEQQNARISPLFSSTTYLPVTMRLEFLFRKWCYNMAALKLSVISFGYCDVGQFSLMQLSIEIFVSYYVLHGGFSHAK